MIYANPSPCKNDILCKVERQPAIPESLERMEKQISELQEVWGRCFSKIGPILAPQDPIGPCEERPTNPVPLAGKIESLTAQIERISNQITTANNLISL